MSIYILFSVKNDCLYSQILDKVEDKLNQIYLLSRLMVAIITTPATILPIDQLCQILGMMDI